MLVSSFCHGFDGDRLLGLGHDYGLPGICQFMTPPMNGDSVMADWVYDRNRWFDLGDVRCGRYLAK